MPGKFRSTQGDSHGRLPGLPIYIVRQGPDDDIYDAEPYEEPEKKTPLHRHHTDQVLSGLAAELIGELLGDPHRPRNEPEMAASQVISTQPRRQTFGGSSGAPYSGDLPNSGYGQENPLRTKKGRPRLFLILFEDPVHRDLIGAFRLPRRTVLAMVGALALVLAGIQSIPGLLDFIVNFLKAAFA
jgi:hypothetical protein